MKWIKASEQLGEFKDSDIPEWKFWHPDFCKLDGKPTERPFFRKDIEKGKTFFSYIYLPGSNFSKELEESEFHRIEWLDETPDPTPSSAEVYRKALEKIINEPGEWNNYKQIARKAIAEVDYPGMTGTIHAAKVGQREEAIGEELWEEVWDEVSEHIDDNVSSLEQVAGSSVITKHSFKKLISKYTITRK
jgi:hypothetical protein